MFALWYVRIRFVMNDDFLIKSFFQRFAYQFVKMVVFALAMEFAPAHHNGLARDVKHVCWYLSWGKFFSQYYWNLLTDCCMFMNIFLAICASPCQNSGTCSAPNTCTCTSSWSGAVCTTRELLANTLINVFLFSSFRIQLSVLQLVRIVVLVLLPILVHAQHSGVELPVLHVCKT